MPHLYKSVKEIIDDRKHIPLEDFNYQVQAAIDFALSSKQQAFELVSMPNRIVQSACRVVPSEMKSLIKKYQNDDAFIKRLWAALNGTSELSKLKEYWAGLKRQGREKGPAVAADVRTQIMGKYNPHVFQQASKPGFFLKAEDIQYPVVDRHTRDFTRPLMSAGAGNREHLLLDVESDRLKWIYEEFVALLEKSDCLVDILKKLAGFTKNIFKAKNIVAPEEVNVIIPLSRFVEQSRGDCRHHALLNAYILSCLNQDKHLTTGLKKQLSGLEVIHHRQKIKAGAHSWNIVKCENGDAFNVDTLWRKGVFKLDEKDLEKQDRFYQSPGFGIDKLMQDNYGCFLKVEEAAQSIDQKTDDNTCKQALLSEIWGHIEKGRIGWSCTLAAIFSSVTLSSGIKIPLPEEVKRVYELARWGSESTAKAEKAYQQIMKQVSGERRILFEQRQALDEYMLQRLVEKKSMPSIPKQDDQKTCKQILLSEIWQDIETERIGWSPLMATVFSRMTLSNGEEVSMPLELKPVYELARLGCESSDEAEKAYAEIMRLVADDIRMVFNEEVPLHKHISQRLLALEGEMAHTSNAFRLI